MLKLSKSTYRQSKELLKIEIILITLQITSL
nr:MAG TPA: hypothetical protein [Caudoviricetes sp.]